MNRSAIYHEPLSHLAFAADEETLIFRILTDKKDQLSIDFYYGDTAHQGHPVPFRKTNMQPVATTQTHRVFECRLFRPFPRLVYYFVLTEGDESLFFYSDHFHSSPSDQRNSFYKYPYHQISDVIKVPAWYLEAIVYNIFPDSYANGKKHICNDPRIKSKHGGTLQSILKNLDSIQQLGVTCLYLNPIFKAGEHHKYDTIDYLQIDPCFGTNDDFKHLVDEIHKRGMKIVLDGVFNHVGSQFSPFQAWLKNPNGPYKNWFFKKFDPLVYPEESSLETVPYASFGYERHMPKINCADPGVQKYFLEVARFWTEEFEIDGWRLDVADESHFDFWRQFRKAVTSINPNAVLIAENWQTARSFLDGSTFDGLMNYDLMNHMIDFFANRSLDALGFSERLSYQITRYRTMHVKAQLNFLNSHDVPRFFSRIQNHIEIYELALVFLMSFNGVPMLFYGDEIPLGGISEEDYRQPMPFNKEANFFTVIHQLTALRKNNQEWVHGEFQVIHAIDDLIIYRKIYQRESSIFVLNRGPSPKTLSNLDGDPILSKNWNSDTLGPFGYLILK